MRQENPATTKLYRKSIAVFAFAGLFVGPTKLSAKLQTTLFAQHSSLQKLQALFPANICLCKCYRSFYRRTFASAKLQTPLFAEHSSLQKLQALFPANIHLCKSYRPFYRRTFASARVTGGFSGEHLSLQTLQVVLSAQHSGLFLGRRLRTDGIGDRKTVPVDGQKDVVKKISKPAKAGTPNEGAVRCPAFRRLIASHSSALAIGSGERRWAREPIGARLCRRPANT
jgi:hypothetical protein